LYFYDEWISRWIFPTPLWRVGSCNPCKIPMNCHISCRGVWWKKHVYFGCWGSLGNTNCRGKLFQMDDVRPKTRSLDSWILPELDPMHWMENSEPPGSWWNHSSPPGTSIVAQVKRLKDSWITWRPATRCLGCGAGCWVNVRGSMFVWMIFIYPILVYIYICVIVCVCDDLYIFQDVKDLKKNMKLYTHVTHLLCVCALNLCIEFHHSVLQGIQGQSWPMAVNRHFFWPFWAESLRFEG
jgi:hypothetical protein